MNCTTTRSDAGASSGAGSEVYVPRITIRDLDAHADVAGQRDDVLRWVTGPEDVFVPRDNLDRYGFSHLLAQRANLKAPRRPFCSWMHGWVWWEEHMETEDLIGPHALPRDLSFVMGSTRQVETLWRAGYRKVVAGGLPFIYVDPQHVQRNNDTLLAFLAHSAESERHEVAHAPYLDYLASLRDKFEAIYVSVFALDSTEVLRSEIARRGLRVLNGANPLDRNSMLRTRRALEYVGHVSANTMGSPVAYALAAGCKTSLWSPVYRYDPTVLSKSVHGFSRAYVERMAHVHSESYLRCRYPELFREAGDGYQDQMRGSSMVGAEHKLDEDAIRRVTGWTVQAQVKGYLAGAARRSLRHARLLLPNPRTA